ncbi:HAD family hydrolase [Notoacmeibacter ruber]|uniref:Phosphoglycolate phosphatase n=1 Tax=Notoacmeibacter ruber TaxID=2670375 RepID=A0A3L7JEU4_9HYPH|nr:HAD family hydrolase [Notoacmeibacter ruber]RLQ88091.1 phosphoglycolate phosphatase [Notoacmeibacter ruber]
MRPTLVFDLDGTLVDTAPDLVDSLNECLVSRGLSPAEEKDIRHLAGHGARVMIQRAFEAQGKLDDLTDDALNALLERFIGHYEANIPGRSKPFPGAVESMKRFADEGWTLAVCTNKFESLATHLLEGLGIRTAFATVSGSDTFAFRKPDPRHLTETIAASGGDPKHSLMLGDSRTDIATAKAAAIPVVAVSFGYSDVPIAELQPERIIDHFDELTIAMADELLTPKQ